MPQSKKPKTKAKKTQSKVKPKKPQTSADKKPQEESSAFTAKATPSTEINFGTILAVIICTAITTSLGFLLGMYEAKDIGHHGFLVQAKREAIEKAPTKLQAGGECRTEMDVVGNRMLTDEARFRAACTLNACRD